MATEEWSLSDEQRSETVSRIKQNIASLAFSRENSLPEDFIAEAAATAEKRAYTVARVEARTTTGVRPHSETLKAYARGEALRRKLAELVLDIAATERRRDGAAAGAAAGRLDLSGEREFLTKESAEAALAPMLAEASTLHTIKLSTKSFGAEAADVAARGIANVSASLAHADLSDVIAGRPEAEALAALRALSDALGKAQLRSLDLSDNALGEKGVRAAAAAFSGQAGLEMLAFQNVGCSIHACKAVAELMPNADALHTFHFFNNMSDDAGAAAIAQVLARAPRMRSFRMASSRVGFEGGVALAQGLSAGSALERLDLSDNPMTGEAAGPLAAMLAQQPRLRSLNLNDTSLGDAGVSTLAQALGGAGGKLEELELALNEVTEAAAGALASALAGKPNLARLVLRENELGDAGAAALAAALPGMRALRVLDLCQNQITRAGAVAVARAVSALPHLELLALDENEISEAGIAQLQSVLKDAGKLDVLGPLDDNLADGDEDGDEDEDEGVGQQDDYGLSEAFAKTGFL